MVRVEYVVDGDTPVQHVQEIDNPHISLAQHGSYCMLGVSHNTSAYHGVAFFDSDTMHMQKVLHRLAPRQPVHTVRVFPDCVVLVSDRARIMYAWHRGVFCCTVQGEATMDVLADVRDVYDQSTDGREHSSAWHQDALHIESRGMRACIYASTPISTVHDWKQVDTSFDERRGNAAGWWTCAVGMCEVQGRHRFVVCPERMHDTARAVLHDDTFFDALIHRTKVSATQIAHDDRATLARTFAVAQIRELTIQGKDAPYLLAGLPWFFQRWSRDELISAGALRTIDPEAFMQLVLNASGRVLPSGQLPNRLPDAVVGSADAFGWLCVQVQRLLDADEHLFSAEQRAQLAHAVCTACDALIASRGDNAFVASGPQETWMDTLGDVNDQRSGYRIEIQALFLASLRLASRLCTHVGRKNVYTAVEHKVHQALLSQLYDAHRSLLADGMQDGRVDWTIRPNALLCAYIYPSLLSNKQWYAVFTTMLPQLECVWGGLATIDKDHSWFHPHHQATNNSSYHRGDVWYWVNNLVACAASRIDPRLRLFSQRICDASLTDLFSQGALARCSEISSYADQEALGCWVQAWSASSLIELIDALR